MLEDSREKSRHSAKRHKEKGQRLARTDLWRTWARLKTFTYFCMRKIHGEFTIAERLLRQGLTLSFNKMKVLMPDVATS